MKNTKRLKNIDRIVFGIMCTLLIMSKQSDWAFIGGVNLLGYFASSVMHTPEYFGSKEGE